MAMDVEPGFPIHQFGKVESDDTGVVSDEADLVSGAQLDEGNGPAGTLFDHLNAAGNHGGGKERGQDEEPENEQSCRMESHGHWGSIFSNPGQSATLDFRRKQDDQAITRFRSWRESEINLEIYL
jgi:hypothetical protein